MKAGPVTIRHLLENRQRFCVPIYQRHYVWTKEKQWEPFWTDIRAKAIERLAGRERRFSHFMGAVVLESRGDISSRRVRSFQVVDGQQRLTTFQVYLAAVRDYADIANFSETVERIEGFLFNEKKHLMEEPEIEVFKVWPTKYDRELFHDILKLRRNKLREKYRHHFYSKKDKIYHYSTVPNLLRAYGFFFECVKYASETDDLDDDFSESVSTENQYEHETSVALPKDRQMIEIKLDALWESLVEEFKVVEIVLEDGDDAQVIFETLNERGEPLLAADLVRNNIFYRADARGENAEDIFLQYWTFFEDPFWSELEKQGRYKKARIEFFLANFLAGKIASEVSISKLFSEYKAFLKINQKLLNGCYQTVEEEIRDLVFFGNIYKRLLERSQDDTLGKFSALLQPWDVTTIYPLILQIWGLNNLSENEKTKCLYLLMSFIVRRAICGLTTKNYNKLFLAALKFLKDNEFSFYSLSIFFKNQDSESSKFPNDYEFERNWINVPVYKNLNRPKVKAILESLEISKRQRFHETIHISENLSVEHVLPSEWIEHWPLDDGLFATKIDELNTYSYIFEDDTLHGKIKRRNRIKNTIGNLTLLTQPLNSKVSNGPYLKKKEAISDHSLLVLNREITKEPNWGELEIEKRGKQLFQLAKIIWPYPTT